MSLPTSLGRTASPAVAPLSHKGGFHARLVAPRLRNAQPRIIAMASDEGAAEQATAVENKPEVVVEAASNGAEVEASSNGNGAAETVAPASLDLAWQEPSNSDKFWTSFKLGFALPWRRFKKGSVLAIKLEGEVPDQGKGFFDTGCSVPQLCDALKKAALDPRVSGLAIEIGPLSVGFAKLIEIRRYLSFFRASGKFTVAFMKQGGEKEYYLASACQEVYAPPSASISLRGFAVGGTFLRGVLDKVGVEPQVQRIGAYKSAGDQLLRKSMAPEQKEQLQALLDDTYAEFVSTVASARGKSEQEVKGLLDAGIYETEQLFKQGWLDGLKYEDELIDDLKKRSAPDDKPEKPLRRVSLRKLNSVNPTAYGLTGKQRIVVLRTAGAIVGKGSPTSSGNITPDGLIPQLRALAKDKRVAGVVLRVDSPGGDALASDLMWREVRKLAEKKPVIASMADVAASGGYYIAMAAQKIVAERLTITGSIGVVTGKFNLAELYAKVGYAKELISKGRYAELLADNRPFSEDEAALFEAAAQHAYESFRDKAAESRGMSKETMQEVAQGRVWSGRVALQRGLVDALGGVHTAVELVKQAAGIKPEEKVTVVEVGRASPSPLALLRGASAAVAAMAAGGSLPAGVSLPALLGLMLAPGLSQVSASGSSSASLASSSLTGSNLGTALSAPQMVELATVLGPSAAQAVATALTSGASSSPFGITYTVDADAVAVQASGSAAAVAAAGGPTGSPLARALSSDEDSFLRE